MPTYNIFTSPGKLTLAQKEEIARVCTEVYHEEFGIARYLIQVVFYEVANNDRYISAKPVQQLHCVAVTVLRRHKSGRGAQLSVC